MARYFLEYGDGSRQQVSSVIYDELITGTAVLRSHSNDRWVDLELSEGLGVRTYAEGNTCYVVLRSNLHGGVRPVRVQLASEEGGITLGVVEERGRHLRRLYALLFLLEIGQLPNALERMSANPQLDPETLLLPEDRLVIEAGVEGSWDNVVKALEKAGKVAKDAGEGTIVVLGGLFQKGRDLLLRWSEAIVRKTEAGATAAEVDVEIKKQELLRKQIDTTVKAEGVDNARRERRCMMKCAGSIRAF